MNVSGAQAIEVCGVDLQAGMQTAWAFFARGSGLGAPRSGFRVPFSLPRSHGVKMYPVDPGHHNSFPRSQDQEFVSILGPCGSHAIPIGTGMVPRSVDRVYRCLLGASGCTP